MSKTESDPTHTETQETTAAVPRGSGPEAAGGRTPQALWDQLRQELRPPVDAIIRSSEQLREDAAGPGQAEFIANLSEIHSAGRQLLEIINDLLDSAQYASGDAVSNLASLVANLYYRVRLPINDVIGISDILIENAAEPWRPDIIADLKRIQSAGAYVLSYINEIIDFSKIDAGLN